MRPLFRSLPMIALLALMSAPLTVFGGTTATMQVSFTVLASCTVSEQGATAPAVDCMQADGFIVGRSQVAPGSTGVAPVTSNSAQGWTVYF